MSCPCGSGRSDCCDWSKFSEGWPPLKREPPPPAPREAERARLQAELDALTASLRARLEELNPMPTGYRPPGEAPGPARLEGVDAWLPDASTSLVGVDRSPPPARLEPSRPAPPPPPWWRVATGRVRDAWAVLTGAADVVRYV